jgi:Hemopexin
MDTAFIDPAVVVDPAVIDTAVSLPGRGLYVFRGDQVWRYTGHRRVADAGYPRPITAEFPGTFQRDLDAALLHPDGSLYLFRGAQHLRYDVTAGRPYPGYPRPYAPDWPGVFPDRIDAAITWAPDIIYLFRGHTYTSFSPHRASARPGYPKPVAGNWPGLRGGPVRAAFGQPGGTAVLLTDTPYLLDHQGQAAPQPDAVPGFVRERGWSEASENPPRMVDPFPGLIPLPRDKANTGFIHCVSTALNRTDLAGLCVAVMDLSVSASDHVPYAGQHDTDMVYVGSMGKLFAAYTAFELRKRVEKYARMRILDGFSTAKRGWQAQIFAELTKAWQPQLNAAFPHLPQNQHPQFDAIVKLGPDGKAAFLQRDPPVTDDELGKVGENHDPPRNWLFLDCMKSALGWSNNESAGRFITPLSFPYINGVLGKAGFFETKTNSGLWVSGNFAGGDWLPDDRAGKPLAPRWQKPGHKVSNFTGTALQVARFLALLAKGILAGQPEDSELIGIMGVPFLENTLRDAHPPRAFTEIHGKVGIGVWGDGRYHDAAIVTVRSDVRYVMALLGSDGHPATLREPGVALHDCVVSRH